MRRGILPAFDEQGNHLWTAGRVFDLPSLRRFSSPLKSARDWAGRCPFKQGALFARIRVASTTSTAEKAEPGFPDTNSTWDVFERDGIWLGAVELLPDRTVEQMAISSEALSALHLGLRCWTRRG